MMLPIIPGFNFEPSKLRTTITSDFAISSDLGNLLINIIELLDEVGAKRNTAISRKKVLLALEKIGGSPIIVDTGEKGKIVIHFTEFFKISEIFNGVKKAEVTLLLKEFYGFNYKCNFSFNVPEQATAGLPFMAVKDLCFYASLKYQSGGES